MVDVVVTKDVTKFEIEGYERLLSSIKGLQGQLEKQNDSLVKINKNQKEGTELAKKMAAAFTLPALKANLSIIQQTTKEVVGFLTEGAKAADLNIAFAKNQKKAWIDLGLVVKELKDGINQTDLQVLLQKARLLQVEVSQLPILARIAANLTAETGVSTKQAFEAMIQAIATGRATTLKQLGVIVDATEANKIFAATNGKTVESLTALEKQTALVNYIIAKNTQLTKEGSDSGVQKIRRLGTAWENSVSDFQESMARLFIGYQKEQKSLADLIVLRDGYKKALELNANVFGSQARNLILLQTTNAEIREQVRLLYEANGTLANKAEAETRIRQVLVGTSQGTFEYAQRLELLKKRHLEELKAITDKIEVIKASGGSYDLERLKQLQIIEQLRIIIKLRKDHTATVERSTQKLHVWLGQAKGIVDQLKNVDFKGILKNWQKGLKETAQTLLENMSEVGAVLRGKKQTPGPLVIGRVGHIKKPTADAKKRTGRKLDMHGNLMSQTSERQGALQEEGIETFQDPQGQWDWREILRGGAPQENNPLSPQIQSKTLEQFLTQESGTSPRVAAEGPKGTEELKAKIAVLLAAFDKSNNAQTKILLGKQIADLQAKLTALLGGDVQAEFLVPGFEAKSPMVKAADELETSSDRIVKAMDKIAAGLGRGDNAYVKHMRNVVKFASAMKKGVPQGLEAANEFISGVVKNDKAFALWQIPFQFAMGWATVFENPPQGAAHFAAAAGFAASAVRSLFSGGSSGEVKGTTPSVPASGAFGFEGPQQRQRLLQATFVFNGPQDRVGVAREISGILNEGASVDGSIWLRQDLVKDRTI